MKKSVYIFAFAIALTSVYPANATASLLATENNNMNNLEVVDKMCYMTFDGKEDCSNLQKPILDPIVPADPVVPVNPDPVIPVIPSDSGTLKPVVVPVVSTATVSSCPSGTTKSSDGCCCVNN